MAQYNPKNSDVYLTASFSQGFDPYPYQGQMPGLEEFNDQAQNHGLPNNYYWDMVVQPGSINDSSTGLHATINHEPVAPVTSYASGVDSFPHSSYTWQGYGCPEIGQQIQPEPTGFLSQGTSFVGVATPETPAAIPGPSSAPLDYQSEDQSGPPTTMFDVGWVDADTGSSTQNPVCVPPQRNVATPFVVTQGTPDVMQGPSNIPLDYRRENRFGPWATMFDWMNAEAGSSIHNPVGTISQPNAQAFYQHSSGLTRTEGLVPAGRFQPYGIPRAWANEHRNAEAGPSTFESSWSTSQPPGWVPETAADVANDQPTTEESEASVTEQTRGWRRKAVSHLGRRRECGDKYRLSCWIQRWNSLPDLPTITYTLAAAADVISTLRPVIYQDHCLFAARREKPTSDAQGPRAISERERKNLGRAVYRELSRHYQLGPNRYSWRRPELLKKVLEDLEDLDPPPSPPAGSAL